MQLLTQKEVAALLKVSIKTVTRLRQNGKLPTVRISNNAIRIPEIAVTLYIEGAKCRNHQDYKSGMNTGMSPTQKTAEVNEIAFGRRIYRSQKSGFRAG